VGEVSTQRAALVVGILQDLGYEAIAFASGRELFVEAARRSDVDLIVLHPNMIRWPLSETLANLRADSRTGGIPIVIHGPAGLRDKMRHHERVLRLVSFASEAQSTADFELQVEPFLRQIKTPPMDSAQRARHREAAIDWLAHIAQGRRTRIFDLSHAEAPLIEALVDPSLAARAIDAVVELASAESQEALFRVAVAQEAAPEVRESAALKLAFHIQRYGLLLKARQLEELHRAWRNEREPAALRTALAGVIGSLKPDAALVGKRLLGDSLEAR
jgi:CheY-like chemotaxis protein